MIRKRPIRKAVVRQSEKQETTTKCVVNKENLERHLSPRIKKKTNAYKSTSKEETNTKTAQLVLKEVKLRIMRSKACDQSSPTSNHDTTVNKKVNSEKLSTEPRNEVKKPNKPNNEESRIQVRKSLRIGQRKSTINLDKTKDKDDLTMSSDRESNTLVTRSRKIGQGKSNKCQIREKKQEVANLGKAQRHNTLETMNTRARKKPEPKPLLNPSVQVTPCMRRRGRKSLNYYESSFETSTKIEPPPVETNKIPIYRQQAHNEEKKPENNKDLYEFDLDSEKRKKGNRRRLNDSSSNEYDKLMEIAAKKVMKKMKSKNRVNIKKKTNKVVIAKKKTNTLIKNDKADGSDKKLTKQVRVVLPRLVTREETERIDAESVKNSTPSRIDEPLSKDDVYFGFDKGDSPKIKIISNVQLSPAKELNISLQSPTKFKQSRPNANSTMLNNIFTPWRFNEINIRRNPHFISVKNDALPSLQQEMVLDHTLVDNFNELSKTPSRINEKTEKSIVQKTLTDYFPSNNENNENKENSMVNQSGLFDNDQLSPIKLNQTAPHKGDSVKRKILQSIDDNVKEIHRSTPLQNKPPTSRRVVEESNHDMTNFGFDSDSDEVCEDNRIKDKDSRPFRVSFNVNDRKYQRKKKNVRVRSPSVSSNEESESFEHSDEDHHVGEIRLFEDIEEPHDDPTLEPKSKRKKRKVRLIDGSVYPAIRRKDKRTKEEEEEAEKWAEAFNSMCEEIEEFPLEIE